jgi:hypothetical protein
MTVTVKQKRLSSWTLETQSDVQKIGSTDSREEGNPEIEVEEDLEAELISALEEIDRLKEKNRKKEKRNCRNMKRRNMILKKQRRQLSS